MQLSQEQKQAEVRKAIGDDPLGGWDGLWKRNLTPWDAGEVQPSFKDVILNSGISFPRTGRALVPGCGKGYDAIFISKSLGLHTIAVDISTSALENANQLLDTSPDAENVEFKELDFFTYEVDESNKYDLTYDYTFFVAIHPTRRSDWGQQMASLVKSGGYLITLMYPLVPPHSEGPPFHIVPEDYAKVLGEDAWEKVWDKIPDDGVSLKSHNQKERIVVWRRK